MPVIDIAEVRRMHARARSAIRDAVQQASAEAGADAVQHQRLYPKFKPRTGALQAATHSRVVMLRNGAKVVVQNAKKYAASIDLGARPHWIKPRALDKPLRFRVGGKWVSAWLVRHPGNQAYRFLYRAIRHGHRMHLQRLESHLRKVGRKI